MSSCSHDEPGARLYRISTYFVVGHEGAALAGHLAGVFAERPPAAITLESLDHQRDLLTLTVEARSTEQDDWKDADTAHELQLHGEMAVIYWTRTAPTLMTVACSALEQVALSAFPISRWAAVPAAAVRVTPLGDPVTALRLDPRRNGRPVTEVDLRGVAPVYGKRLAGLVRDNVDDERWGPARHELPTVRYDPDDFALRLGYRELDEGDGTPWDGGLFELACALRHCACVVGAVGAIGATAIEAATRIAPDPR